MRRFILDDDGNNFFKHMGDDVAADVAEVVRECHPDVTTYFVCSGAGRCFWPSKVNDISPHDGPLLAAHRRGIDPLGMWLEKLKEAGKETFITYRMNDVHNPTEGWNTPRIRREHPDWIVGHGETLDGTAGWMSYCLDYSRPEVRQYVLALIQEQIQHYGHIIDGFQLDWMRFPRHLSGTPDEVWQKRDIMTEFTAEVRRLLKSTGRQILLCARVPTTNAGCKRLGFDIKTWAQRDLIDLLVPCPFLTTDWQIPVDEFRDLLGGKTIPIYSGFDLGFGPQIHFPESLRGICTSLYDSKPDGLYIFNHQTWIERLAARPYHWLGGLNDPRTACAKPLLLAVNHRRSRVEGVDQQAVTPATIQPGATAAIPMFIPSAALPAWRSICLADCGCDLELQVNAAPAHRYPPPHRSEIFLEFVNHYRPKSLRSGPDDCRHFRIDPSALKSGQNQFAFTNHTSEVQTVRRLNLALW